MRRERTVLVLNALHKPYYSEILRGTHRSRLIEQLRNAGAAPSILYSAMKIAAVDAQAVGMVPIGPLHFEQHWVMAHVRDAFKIAHLRQDRVVGRALQMRDVAMDTD